MGIVHQVNGGASRHGEASRGTASKVSGKGAPQPLDLSALDRAQVRAVTGGLHWTRYEAWRRFAAAFHAALGLGFDAPKLERVLAALGVVVHTAPAWLFMRQWNAGDGGSKVIDVEAIIRVDRDGTTTVALSDGLLACERDWNLRMAIAVRAFWLMGARFDLESSGPLATDDHHFGVDAIIRDLEVPGQTLASMLLIPEAMLRSFVPEENDALFVEALDEDNVEAVRARDEVVSELERRSFAGPSACYAISALTEPEAADYAERFAREVAKEWLEEDRVSPSPKAGPSVDDVTACAAE